MTKRRFSSTGESFNWELCILCQEKQLKEKLSCPAVIERKNHDPAKSYRDIL